MPDDRQTFLDRCRASFMSEVDAVQMWQTVVELEAEAIRTRFEALVAARSRRAVRLALVPAAIEGDRP